jgi:hypothetical protein
MKSNNHGETAMGEEVRDFHFNVNVRAGNGAKATMANNEDSFLRAMEIQERRRAKKKLENPKQEEIAEAAPIVPPELIQEKVGEPAVSSEAPAEATPAVEAETSRPAKEPAVTKLSGGGVPGPTPRSDFTSEERTAMMKRAKAHALEVAARKNK